MKKNLAKWFLRLSRICFLLLLLPLVLVIITAMNGQEANTVSNGFFTVRGISIALTVGLGIATAVFMLAYLVVIANSNRQIVAKGQDAQAKILSVKDLRTRIKHNPVVYLLLEVYPPNSPSFQVRVSQTVSTVHLPSYQPGKIVNVKYLPDSKEVVIVGAKGN